MGLIEILLVTPYNIVYLQELVRNGPTTYQFDADKMNMYILRNETYAELSQIVWVSTVCTPRGINISYFRDDRILIENGVNNYGIVENMTVDAAQGEHVRIILCETGPESTHTFFTGLQQVVITDYSAILAPVSISRTRSQIRKQ
ncbi:hypothetical protein QCA50_010111 [Cerrena zonata]|uniref:Uncharacterized protein n=1 Tax=Cerrena zonata TaxID=2478898 RepID=A0AAW0FYC4_9APHY